MDSILFIILLLALVNFFGFGLVWADKKKSVNHSERVPEVYFFFLASCFASLGVLLGMFFFHHKTRKIYFPLGISLLIIQQALLVLYILRMFS